eukprot:4543388-Prorocentrum_lima.AAC.1
MPKLLHNGTIEVHVKWKETRLLSQSPFCSQRSRAPLNDEKTLERKGLLNENGAWEAEGLGMEWPYE